MSQEPPWNFEISKSQISRIQDRKKNGITPLVRETQAIENLKSHKSPEELYRIALFYEKGGRAFIQAVHGEALIFNAAHYRSTVIVKQYKE